MQTPFGLLKMLIIIDYYDQPLTFIVRDCKGIEYYGFLYNDIRQNNEFYCEEFLFVPISKQRREDLLQGRISMRDTVLKPEDGWMIKVRYYNEDLKKQDEYNIINVKDIDKDYLPDADIFVETIYKEYND
jgi:hypothetical protein